MSTSDNETLRQAVRARYGAIAASGSCGCAPSCCTPGATTTKSRELGYSSDELQAAPDGADLGLGCGNPQAIASLAPGETVLDLGSGAGFDCFLAARAVGAGGRVIGVDMTPEMIDRARANASKGDYRNVEFRLGELENLPLADASVDVVISNCVINLVPDKRRALTEALRVLRPGGRLAIADIVAREKLPEHLRDDLALHTGCIAGAATIADVESMLLDAGFERVRIVTGDRRVVAETASSEITVADFVTSASIEAVKPALRGS